LFGRKRKDIAATKKSRASERKFYPSTGKKTATQNHCGGEKDRASVGTGKGGKT